MKGGKLVGVVTEKMLLDFMPARRPRSTRGRSTTCSRKTPVTAAMNPKPHTVSPDPDLAEAAKLLHDRKLNGVLVVDANGDLVGILTTTNALEALIHFSKRP